MVNTLKRLRFPSLGALLALFLSPATTAGALSSFHSAVNELRGVVNHQSVLAREAGSQAADYEALASQERARQNAAQEEAKNAQRAIANFNKLLGTA